MEAPKIDVEIVRALYNYTPSEEGRLPFKAGDTICVVKKLDSGWWDGINDGLRGWFPSNFVTAPETVKMPPKKSFGWVRRRNRDNLRIYYNIITGETIAFQQEQCADYGETNVGNESTVEQIVEHHGKTLPLHWGSKVTADGRTYFYNMISNETTWNLEDIDFVTGRLKEGKSEGSPKPLAMPVETLNSTPGNEWENARTVVFRHIQELKKHAAAREKAKYLETSQKIVMAIQEMFVASGTLDKDSIPLHSNKMLAIHHRHILKSLSRLILSTKQAAGIWPPPDAPNVMCNDANEVLLAVRHFTNSAEEAGIRIKINQTNRNYGESSAKEHSLMTSIDEGVGGSAEIIESIDNHPKHVSEAIMELHKAIREESKQADLINLTRNIVTEVGQFLSVIEEMNVAFVNTEVLAEFEKHKEMLYNAIRSLVSSTTSTVDPLPNVDVLDQILTFSSAVESCVNDLCISAKYILEEKEVMEQLDLQYDADKFDDDKSTSELSLEPRRALSMNHLHQSVDIPSTSSNPQPVQQKKLFPAQSDTDLSRSLDKSITSSMMSRLRITPPVSPTSPTSDESLMMKSRLTFPQRYKPRAISSSSPSPRRVTVSSSKSSKLTRIFGEEISKETASSPDKEWFLGFDHDPKDLILSIEGQVKGATLPALIEKMTFHDNYDTNLTQAFLLTYRSFTSAAEFLQLLIDRYTISPPDGLDDQQQKIWFERKLKPIRLRVFNVMKTWLDSYFMEDDYNLIEDLQQFALQVMKDTMPLAAEQLLKLIERRQLGGTQKKSMTPFTPTEKIPTPILPKSLRRIRFMDIDPLEMARQITIMESKLYCSISPIECLGKAWSDKENNRAPNIKAMIEATNQITGWVAEAILLEKDIKKRCSILKYFILVGEKCCAINNFNALMAILAALNSSPIHRLKRTKELLSSKTRGILEDLKRLMAPGQNFSNYRSQLRSVNPPCVPFLGMYLTDLTFIEDGNGDFVKSMPHMINFDKRWKCAEKIRELQQYQSHYELLEVEEIQNYIHSVISSSTKDAEELYQRSLQIEPREREDEKIARLLHESGFL